MKSTNFNSKINSNNNETITDMTKARDELIVLKELLKKTNKEQKNKIQKHINKYKKDYEVYLKNSGIENDHQKLIDEYYNNLKGMEVISSQYFKINKINTNQDISDLYDTPQNSITRLASNIKEKMTRSSLPGFTTGFSPLLSTSQIIGLKHKDDKISQPYEVVSEVEIGEMLDNPSQINRMIEAYTDAIDKIKNDRRELTDPETKKEIKEDVKKEIENIQSQIIELKAKDIKDNTKKEEIEEERNNLKKKIINLNNQYGYMVTEVKNNKGDPKISTLSTVLDGLLTILGSIGKAL